MNDIPRIPLQRETPELDFLAFVEQLNSVTDRMATLQIYYLTKGATLLFGGLRGATEVVTDGGPIDDEPPTAERTPDGRVVSDRACLLRVSEFQVLIGSGQLGAAHRDGDVFEFEVGSGPRGEDELGGLGLGPLLVRLEVEA
jgi:hypothetical protein